MGTISWRLTHSVTPRLRTIIYVSSKILSVFFITLSERQNYFRIPRIYSFSVPVLFPIVINHLIIHLIITLMMRDWHQKDHTCHHVDFLSKLHNARIQDGPEKMTIENTTKDMFKVRGLDCIYSRAM